MLVNLQANVGGKDNKIWKSFRDIIYCNNGGKGNMSLMTKNIPPMEHDDIPSEIQVKCNSSSTGNYTRLSAYDKRCYLDEFCTEETPLFRFQLIYDGFDFLYYPEFKLYERPYLLLDGDVAKNSNAIIFYKNGVNDEKNLAYLIEGERVQFKDYGITYEIATVIDNPNYFEVYFDRDIAENYQKNDILVFSGIKYEDSNKSNLLTDSTANILSPFKFKFLSGIKDYKIKSNLGSSSDLILQNNNVSSFIDLQGDSKFVSLSDNVEILPDTTMILNNSIGETDTGIEFTSVFDDKLDIHSYFAIKSDNGLEIMRVVSIESDTSLIVERSQLGTVAISHTASSSSIYMPRFINFILLPYNKKLDKRYVAYRNIDFVLTWV